MNVNYEDERFKNLAVEKQTELDKYNQTYNDLISQREQLTQQQQNMVDEWKNTQTEIANNNLQHQVDLYNQQKEQANKDYQREASASYSDYLKEVDKYGVSRENVVANGLSNSGYAESSKVDMYNTYQNRLASARQSLNDIKLEFDNAIKEAQLSNNATLAELALQQMQQKLEIALEGFNYKDTATQNKLNWEYNINNNYYNRYQDVEDQINYENEQAEAIRQYNEQMAFQKEQAEIAQQQWEKEYALAKKSASSSSRSSSSSSNSSYSLSGGTSASTNSNGTDAYGNSAETQQKSDYLFQDKWGQAEKHPQYINNEKVVSVGKLNEVYSSLPSNIKPSQNIWKQGGRYYVWVKTSDTSGQYVDITDDYKYTQSKKVCLDWR